MLDTATAEENILGFDDPKNRDLRIIKTCDTCGRKYHPRKNSYQVTSRFCSKACAKKGRKKMGH